MHKTKPKLKPDCAIQPRNGSGLLYTVFEKRDPLYCFPHREYSCSDLHIIWYHHRLAMAPLNRCSV